MLFDFTSVTPASIALVADDAIAGGEALVADVLAVTGDRTFDNTIRPLEEITRLSMVALRPGPVPRSGINRFGRP